MKFKDKDGNVFDSVREIPCLKSCRDCAVDKYKSEDESCLDFMLGAPTEAARLMGLEVVEDIPCKHGQSQHKNELGEDEIFCELTARWMNVSLGDCLGNCESEAVEEDAIKAVKGMCCDCAHDTSGNCCDWNENEKCPYWRPDGSCWIPHMGERDNMDEQKPGRLAPRNIGTTRR